MIKIENTEVVGWEHAIRGMRNPKNSWDKSDSGYVVNDIEKPYSEWEGFSVGPNDKELMQKLCKAGTDHRKFMRMIVVYADITAPLYWWKEFDTYKVGTVANSCSTMHKIHEKEFTLDDFSHEHLDIRAIEVLKNTIDVLNDYRNLYVNYDADNFEIKGCPSKKDIWWQMIQLLPSSYNQRRTVMLNYEVLANMYKPTSRRYHKQDEWNVNCVGSLCYWIETLPHSEFITQKFSEK